MTRTRHPALARRLAAALILMNLVTVLLVGIFAVTLGNRDIDQLVRERQSDITRSLRASAIGAYGTGIPGWSDVDLDVALRVAASTGTQAAVLDEQGRLVASSMSDPTQVDDAAHSPITRHGERIGTLAVRFTPEGLMRSVDRLRTSLLAATLIAVGLATVVSMPLAVFIARRSTRPIADLTNAARAMGAGDRDTRVGTLRTASKELTGLGMAFDGMADMLNQQETLRRDLITDIAHELRTPVAILQATCEALLDDVVPHTPEQTASLHEEVVRLAILVDDLQSLAHADAAALQLSLTRCDLTTLVDLAVDSMQPRFHASGLSVTRHLEPAVIEADATRMHQIITNMLSNAEKFTPIGGQIHVELTTRTGRAWLRITDTGVGISPEDLPHIFERFRRGAHPIKTSGSGIGLSIVATLVHAHHGSVEVDTQLGTGTSISLTFPLADPIGTGPSGRS